MQVKGDATLNKLIILFVFDKMEVPLSENTILDMCCSSNNWIAYMDPLPRGKRSPSLSSRTVSNTAESRSAWRITT